MTSSPRLIGIKFGYGFDPEERLAFTLRAQFRNLRRDAVAHGFRARIRHDEPQLAQALRAAPPAHHPHPLGGLGQFALIRCSLLLYVTRYGAKTRTRQPPATSAAVRAGRSSQA